MLHPYENCCFNKNINACYWVLAMIFYNLTSICLIDFLFIGGLYLVIRQLYVEYLWNLKPLVHFSFALDIKVYLNVMFL